MGEPSTRLTRFESGGRDGWPGDVAEPHLIDVAPGRRHSWIQRKPSGSRNSWASTSRIDRTGYPLDNLAEDEAARDRVVGEQLARRRGRLRRRRWISSRASRSSRMSRSSASEGSVAHAGSMREHVADRDPLLAVAGVLGDVLDHRVVEAPAPRVSISLWTTSAVIRLRGRVDAERGVRRHRDLGYLVAVLGSVAARVADRPVEGSPCPRAGRRAGGPGARRSDRGRGPLSQIRSTRSSSTPASAESASSPSVVAASRSSGSRIRRSGSPISGRRGTRGKPPES